MDELRIFRSTGTPRTPFTLLLEPRLVISVLLAYGLFVIIPLKYDMLQCIYDGAINQNLSQADKSKNFDSND